MKHVKTKKHKMIVDSRASKNTVNSHPQVKTVGVMEGQAAAQGTTLAFLTVVHNCSFRSMDCTTAIVKTFFQPEIDMLSDKTN
jgi:pyruvate/2-oxoglutarate dehydrogenase complex dihydrolipoamide dehydrogenase (E3) component